MTSIKLLFYRESITMRNGKAATRSQFIGLVLLTVVLGFFVGSCIGIRGKQASVDFTVAEEAAITAGKEYGVDPAFIIAVMKKESRFDANALGAAGEIGLMQVMPATAQEWADSEGVRFKANDLYDPLTNARAGAWYLRVGLDLWQHKSDPYPYSLARYNAGQSRALRWDKEVNKQDVTKRFIEQIDISTTQRYVKDILIDYRGYVAE